jgi:hypothetical protein
VSISSEDSITLSSHFGRVWEHGPSSQPIVAFLALDCTLGRDLSRKSTSFSTHLQPTLDPFAGADTALALVPRVAKSRDATLSCFTTGTHPVHTKNVSLLASFLESSYLVVDATFAPVMVMSEEMIPFDKDIPIVVSLNSMLPYDDDNYVNNNDDGDDFSISSFEYLGVTVGGLWRPTGRPPSAGGSSYDSHLSGLASAQQSRLGALQQVCDNMHW